MVVETGRAGAVADKLGIVASGLCLVHCLLTPLILSYSAVLAHLLPGEESTHRMLAVAVTSLGVFALVRGFRLHRRRRVLGMMACGLTCILCGAWWGDRLPAHWMEVLVTGVGSSFLIAAHRINHTFCRDCTRCVPGEAA